MRVDAARRGSARDRDCSPCGRSCRPDRPRVAASPSLLAQLLDLARRCLPSRSAIGLPAAAASGCRCSGSSPRAGCRGSPSAASCSLRDASRSSRRISPDILSICFSSSFDLRLEAVLPLRRSAGALAAAVRRRQPASSPSPSLRRFACSRAISSACCCALCMSRSPRALCSCSSRRCASRSWPSAALAWPARSDRPMTPRAASHRPPAASAAPPARGPDDCARATAARAAAPLPRPARRARAGCAPPPCPPWPASACCRCRSASCCCRRASSRSFSISASTCWSACCCCARCAVSYWLASLSRSCLNSSARSSAPIRRRHRRRRRHRAAG